MLFIALRTAGRRRSPSATAAAAVFCSVFSFLLVLPRLECAETNRQRNVLLLLGECVQFSAIFSLQYEENSYRHFPQMVINI